MNRVDNCVNEFDKVANILEKSEKVNKICTEKEIIQTLFLMIFTDDTLFTENISLRKILDSSLQKKHTVSPASKGFLITAIVDRILLMSEYFSVVIHTACHCPER